MRMLFLAGILIFCGSAFGREANEPKLLAKVAPLPMALDPDFQFRKTKLYFLSEKGTTGTKTKSSSKTAGDNTQTTGSAAKSKSTSVVQDASINFERQYRLFGAVTKLDQHQRYGDYLDFYWRLKRPSDVTVRLEYRQEQLHAHVQAQEISYANVRGANKTEFKVVGDDYFDNGRITAWRCLLIHGGQIVAENRSFMWR